MTTSTPTPMTLLELIEAYADASVGYAVLSENAWPAQRGAAADAEAQLREAIEARLQRIESVARSPLVGPTAGARSILAMLSGTTSRTPA